MLLLKTAQSLILVSPTSIIYFFLHNHITKKQALFNEYQSVIGFPRLKKKDIIIGLAALPCP